MRIEKKLMAAIGLSILMALPMTGNASDAKDKENTDEVNSPRIVVVNPVFGRSLKRKLSLSESDADTGCSSTQNVVRNPLLYKIPGNSGSFDDLHNKLLANQHAQEKSLKKIRKSVERDREKLQARDNMLKTIGQRSEDIALEIADVRICESDLYQGGAPKHVSNPLKNKHKEVHEVHKQINNRHDNWVKEQRKKRLGKLSTPVEVPKMLHFSVEGSTSLRAAKREGYPLFPTLKGAGIP